MDQNTSYGQYGNNAAFQQQLQLLQALQEVKAQPAAGAQPAVNASTPLQAPRYGQQVVQANAATLPYVLPSDDVLDFRYQPQTEEQNDPRPGLQNNGRHPSWQRRLLVEGTKIGLSIGAGILGFAIGGALAGPAGGAVLGYTMAGALSAVVSGGISAYDQNEQQGWIDWKQAGIDAAIGGALGAMPIGRLLGKVPGLNGLGPIKWVAELYDDAAKFGWQGWLGRGAVEGVIDGGTIGGLQGAAVTAYVSQRDTGEINTEQVAQAGLMSAGMGALFGGVIGGAMNTATAHFQGKITAEGTKAKPAETAATNNPNPQTPKRHSPFTDTEEWNLPLTHDAYDTRQQLLTLFKVNSEDRLSAQAITELLEGWGDPILLKQLQTTLRENSDLGFNSIGEGYKAFIETSTWRGEGRGNLTILMGLGKNQKPTEQQVDALLAEIFRKIKNNPQEFHWNPQELSQEYPHLTPKELETFYQYAVEALGYTNTLTQTRIHKTNDTSAHIPLEQVSAAFHHPVDINGQTLTLYDALKQLQDSAFKVNGEIKVRPTPEGVLSPQLGRHLLESTPARQNISETSENLWKVLNQPEHTTIKGQLQGTDAEIQETLTMLLRRAAAEQELDQFLASGGLHQYATDTWQPASKFELLEHASQLAKDLKAEAQGSITLPEPLAISGNEPAKQALTNAYRHAFETLGYKANTSSSSTLQVHLDTLSVQAKPYMAHNHEVFRTAMMDGETLKPNVLQALGNASTTTAFIDVSGNMTQASRDLLRPKTTGNPKIHTLDWDSDVDKNHTTLQHAQNNAEQTIRFVARKPRTDGASGQEVVLIAHNPTGNAHPELGYVHFEEYSHPELGDGLLVSTLHAYDNAKDYPDIENLLLRLAVQTSDLTGNQGRVYIKTADGTLNPLFSEDMRQALTQQLRETPLRNENFFWIEYGRSPSSLQEMMKKLTPIASKDPAYVKRFQYLYETWKKIHANHIDQEIADQYYAIQHVFTHTSATPFVDPRLEDIGQILMNKFSMERNLKTIITQSRREESFYGFDKNLKDLATAQKAEDILTPKIETELQEFLAQERTNYERMNERLKEWATKHYNKITQEIEAYKSHQDNASFADQLKAFEQYNSIQAAKKRYDDFQSAGFNSKLQNTEENLSKGITALRKELDEFIQYRNALAQAEPDAPILKRLNDPETAPKTLAEFKAFHTELKNYVDQLPSQTTHAAVAEPAAALTPTIREVAIPNTYKRAWVESAVTEELQHIEKFVVAQQRMAGLGAEENTARASLQLEIENTLQPQLWQTRKNLLDLADHAVNNDSSLSDGTIDEIGEVVEILRLTEDPQDVIQYGTQLAKCLGITLPPNMAEAGTPADI